MIATALLTVASSGARGVKEGGTIRISGGPGSISAGSHSSETRSAAANAAHEGHQEAVYALSQLHSYDWLTFNAAWATIVLGATQLTPFGFLGSLLIPPWLIVVGIWLFWKSEAAVPVVGLGEDEVALST